MAYEARILADTINTCGNRLTTFEVTYPRFVHAELMTHRMLSRNSASSRAIPVQKMIDRVLSDPVIPIWWGKNQPGMQANEELEEKERDIVRWHWLDARDNSVAAARQLSKDGVHKQIVNRLLEPWMWITVIVSATEWDNFFHLRCHPDAQPEIRKIADMMQDLYKRNIPITGSYGYWHTPLIQPDEEFLYTEDRIKVSVGRCARVSYLTHDGKRDLQADIDLCDKLIASGHWSPFEHVARALTTPTRHGNFIGWRQYRKEFRDEHYGKILP